jgi:hypothetical protein
MTGRIFRNFARSNKNTKTTISSDDVALIEAKHAINLELSLALHVSFHNATFCGSAV